MQEITILVAGHLPDARKDLKRVGRAARLVLNTSDQRKKAELLKGVHPEFRQPEDYLGGRTIFEAVTAAVVVEQQQLEQGYTSPSEVARLGLREPEETGTPATVVYRRPSRRTQKSELGKQSQKKPPKKKGIPYGYVSAEALSNETGIPRNKLNTYLQYVQGRQSFGQYGYIFPSEQTDRVIPQLQEELEASRVRTPQRKGIPHGYTSVTALSEATGISKNKLNNYLQYVHGKRLFGKYGFIFPSEQVEKVIPQLQAELEAERATATKRRSKIPYGYVPLRVLTRETGLKPELLDEYLQFVHGRHEEKGRIIFPIEQVTAPIVQLQEEMHTEIPTGRMDRFQAKRQFKLSNSVLDAFVLKGLDGEVSSVEGGLQTYDSVGVAARVAEYHALPVVDRDSRTFTDESGEVWASERRASILLRAQRTVRLLTEDIESKTIKGTRGEIMVVYRLSDLQSKLDKYREGETDRRREGALAAIGKPSPVRGKEPELSNEQLGVLVNKNQIRKQFGIGFSILDNFVLRDIPVLEEEGKRSMYDLETVTERVRMYQELPVLDPETKVYTDASGEQWVLIISASKILRASSTTVSSFADQAETTYVKGSKGEVLAVYKLSHLRLAYDEFKVKDSVRRRKARLAQASVHRSQAEGAAGSFMTFQRLYEAYPDVSPEKIRDLLLAAERAESTDLEIVTVGKVKTFHPDHAASAIEAYRSRRVKPGAERLEVDGVLYVSARQLAAEFAARGIAFKDSLFRSHFNKHNVPFIDAYAKTKTVKLFQEDVATQIILKSLLS
jgi:predicted regulator of Ras-like GTPase activity (Roadblock/LC7/MglB family)